MSRPDGKDSLSSPGSTGPPDPADCTGPEDLGRIHHDTASDIWYECFLDRRTGDYTWAIIPSPD
jgi:hypothetical protein